MHSELPCAMSNHTLTSSHVNYLVWRYLQESGYGDSARLLARDWDINPENLPFSKSVRPQTLVNVIQDGLWVDQLEADLHQTVRRYGFCTRYAFNPQIEDGDNYNGTNHRPLRTVQLSPNRRDSGDKFPNENSGTYIQRRKRHIVDVETQGNGELISMSSEKAAFAALSETFTTNNGQPLGWEQQRSSSMGHTGRSIGVQCEKSTDLTPNGIIFSVKANPDAVIHTKWSPVDPHTFLIACESRPEFYIVPSSIVPTADVSQINSYHSILNEPAMVTALTWISATDAVLAIWNESVSMMDGDLTSSRVIILRSLGTEATVISSIVQVVFALRWHADSKRLLGICGNDLNGAIWLWEAATSNTSHFLPVGTTILDAVWLTDSSICVCGHKYLQVYVVGDKLELQKSFSTQVLWEQVKYEPTQQTIACISLEQNILGIFTENDEEVEIIELKDGNSTAMEFQQPMTDNKIASSEEGVIAILAIAFDSGIVQLRDARKPSEIIRRLRMDVPVMAIAFSPDGHLLAAAGLDSVTIWNSKTGVIPQATWRASADRWKTDVFGDDVESGLDHSLSWNSDGEKLIYMLGNQAAVISYADES